MKRAHGWVCAAMTVALSGCVGVEAGEVGEPGETDEDLETRHGALSYTRNMFGGDVMYAAQGDVLWSSDGRFRLRMQTDCNLVLYSGSTAKWASHTANGSSTCRVRMQTDGNLVVYRGSTAVWDSNTNGYPGAWLTLQNDRNLVIYYRYTLLGVTWISPIWASNTALPKPEHPGCFLSRVENSCSWYLANYCTEVWNCDGRIVRDPEEFCGVCSP